MDWTFWLALIFVIAAIGAYVGGWLDEEFRMVYWGGAIGSVVAAVLFTIVASANVVPVRSVGIVTTFGKPTGDYTGSGLKFVEPWKRVAEWDASVQTADHIGDKCITVRIGSMATACVENRVRWQVKESAAPAQYIAYKGSFDNMRQNLFETELQNAMNEAFSDYNPIGQIDISTGQTKFDNTDLQTEVRDLLNRKVGEQITVESVSIPLVKHDPKTEDNIKQFQDVIAQKRILEQRKQNAELEKQAAEKLKHLPSQYAENKCLDIAEKLGKEPGLCVGKVTTTWPVR